MSGRPQLSQRTTPRNGKSGWLGWRGAVTVTRPSSTACAIERRLVDERLEIAARRNAAARALDLAGVDPVAHQLPKRLWRLSLEVTRTHEKAYGVVYEIEGPIKTPSGRTVAFGSVWQVDSGTDVPRFITMYPRGRPCHLTCTAT